jgi:hypothetical protein
VKRGPGSACVAAVLAVVACRQLVGIEDQPPGPATADGGSGEAASEAAVACGGFPWRTEACSTCVESACCPEATTCGGTPSCISAFDCLARCAGNDDSCRSACLPPAPDDATLALAVCQSKSCAPACGLTCGGFFGFTRGTPGPCTSCLAAKTCPAATECAQSKDCLEVQFCGAACLPLDRVCVLNCEFGAPLDPSFDAGLGLAAGRNDCATACGLGTTWSCLGHAVWPVPAATTISFQVQVVDGSTFDPLAAAQVSACPALDQNCSTPLSTGTTDSNGLVTLTSSTVPFSGYVQIVAPGYWTDLFYIYPYLTESTVPGLALNDTIYSTGQMAQIAAQAHVTLDPSLGIIAADPNDCTASPAAGVSFSGLGLGDAAAPYYFVGSTPTPLATATSLPDSAGGFYNVAPGLVTLSASENGTTIDTVAVYVRGSALTQLQLVPTP